MQTPCKDAVSRLLVMTLMSGVELPEKSVMSMIASAIKRYCPDKEVSDGGRKISEISEINKSDDGLCAFSPEFLYDAETNLHKNIIKD
jgi:pilus assembly protein CpaF